MSHKGAPLLAKADIRMSALCQKQTCLRSGHREIQPSRLAWSHLSADCRGCK